MCKNHEQTLRSTSNEVISCLISQMSYVIETNLVRNFNVHLGCEPREIAYFP